jgi:hypothetical protein
VRTRKLIGGQHKKVRRPFVDLVTRQLDLFEAEHAGLVGDVEAALAAYNRASRDEAEARYGDFLDLVGTGTDELIELRENYASSLDQDMAEAYRVVFNDAVRDRLPRFGLEMDE